MFPVDFIYVLPNNKVTWITIIGIMYNGPDFIIMILSLHKNDFIMTLSLHKNNFTIKWRSMGKCKKK